jgi:hypothetical protein
MSNAWQRQLSVVSVVCVLGLGCSSAVGGPVDGGLNGRCDLPDGGQLVQETSLAACTPVDGGMAAAEYGETNYGTHASDDDCKYDVSFTVTPVSQGENATFVVRLASRTDGLAVSGASTRHEVYLNDTHPAPNSGATVTESPAGTYTIGPVRFDASGRWTARFHFFETCADDSEQSPHGHAAFYLDVP